MRRIRHIRHFMSLSLLAIIVAGSVAAQEDTLKTKIDSMFVIASSGDFEYRDLVEPTIEDMAAIGVPAVPYLIDRLGTIDARERVTLEQILRKIGQPAVPLLIDALFNTDSLQLSRVATILFYLPDTSSVTGLISVADNDYYWVRYQTIRALGKIGDLRAVETVKTALKDKNELVRTMAAVAAGRIGSEHFIDDLITALSDDYYGVRFSAEEALNNLDCAQKKEYIWKSFHQNESLPYDCLPLCSHLLRVLESDSCRYDYDYINQYSNEKEPVVKAAIYHLLYRADPVRFKEQYAGRLDSATALIEVQALNELLSK